MSFEFRPAKSFTERHGLFVSLTGGTNSGKTFSALRLARGIAGPKGKIAVLDTEGGRTLHLKNDFDFDADVMDPPFRPQHFAEAAKSAETAGYDALLIDSFSMEWVGIGGVLDWQEEELSAMVTRAVERRDQRTEYAIREAGKMAAWIKPKMAHKAMVYSFLQRRIPIIFAIRGEESVKPGENREKPTKIFKSICSATFPFEVTVSFRLASDRKGIIDLGDPASWKMEKDHRAIFQDGEQINEEHGAALAAWARGAAAVDRPAKAAPPDDDPARDWADGIVRFFAAAKALAKVHTIATENATGRARMREERPELADMIDAAELAAVQRLTPKPEPAGDGWPGPDTDADRAAA